ncbi:Cation/H(+) antiporter 4 [Linum grandiflorum]
MNAFPVVFHLLVELRLTNSELGRLALSWSLISELFSSFLEISFTIITEKHGLTVFDVTSTAQHLGPFVVGLAVPVGSPLGSSLVDCLKTMTNSVLLPLFVVTSSMRAGNLIFTSFVEFPDRGFYITSIVISLLVKFVICLLVSLTWMPPVDSAVLALIMSSKGIRELGLYSGMRDFGIMSEQLFTLCLTYIILNATLIPICVKYMYDPSRKYAGYQARNLFALKPNTDLKILICVHKPHQVGHMITLLDILHSTENDPIEVYALHLVELVGRATPMLISHRNQRVMSDNCSIEVIIAFNQLERRTFRRTSVNNFTSISQPEFMHDDICTLALDKSASLILIPFHVTWAFDGGIESEDASVRMLNSKVELTILHLIAKECSCGGRNSRLSDEENSAGYERLTDDVVLELALKEVDVLPNVRYVDEVVEDGHQTAMAIRSRAEDHDLFVVGRRRNVESPQTIGLDQWSEFPELGVVGDLLASKHMKTKDGVLIVQQQRQIK